MPDNSLTAATTPAIMTVAEAAVVARLRTAGCVFAEDEARLLIAAASTPHELAGMVDRRVAGLPLEHVVGWAEFCGLRVIVGPGVFVPRRRSEFLVSQAVAATAAAGEGPVVLDLCCGSGAVGLAVVTALGEAELHAADIDPGATAYARRNLAVIGGHVHVGNLYDPLPARLRGRIELIVVNAPYVPTADIGLMPPEARLHEPEVALDGGIDGVGIHRRVAAGAGGWLAPSGSLLIETSERQAPLTRAAMVAAGLAATIASDDELDATVVIGRPRSSALGRSETCGDPGQYQQP
jgi:release factor glutamine methyltransferase